MLFYVGKSWLILMIASLASPVVTLPLASVRDYATRNNLQMRAGPPGYPNRVYDEVTSPNLEDHSFSPGTRVPRVVMHKLVKEGFDIEHHASMDFRQDDMPRIRTKFVEILSNPRTPIWYYEYDGSMYIIAPAVQYGTHSPKWKDLLPTPRGVRGEVVHPFFLARVRRVIENAASDRFEVQVEAVRTTATLDGKERLETLIRKPGFLTNYPALLEQVRG